MSRFDALLERNRIFAASAARSDIPIIPRQQVMLLTCLDPRVEPSAVLGLDFGDVMVIRNAGGRITPGTLADIAFIGFMGEQMNPEGPLFEVAVMHHTLCGTAVLADPVARARFASRTGTPEQSLADMAVTDPYATVRADVAAVLAAPQVPSRITVSGHVYDLATGLVTTVEPARSPASVPSAERSA